MVEYINNGYKLASAGCLNPMLVQMKQQKGCLKAQLLRSQNFQAAFY